MVQLGEQKNRKMEKNSQNQSQIPTGTWCITKVASQKKFSKDGVFNKTVLGQLGGHMPKHKVRSVTNIIVIRINTK